ncbi:MAG TPA: bifunctional YncE family protein/alkaline phosphatase family protein [Fimbriimonadaceae bacterium]|nr:bifunctional YncE family protein/alkaline phosphatase family protein [Fimbriimonadaceae bacterium]
MRVWAMVVIGSLLLGGCIGTKKVGTQSDGSILVPTGQFVRPVGTVVAFNGRPVDLAISPDRTTLFVKDHRGLVVVDVASKRVVQELAMAGGSSLHGIAVAPDDTVWLSNAGSFLRRAVPKEGKWTFDGEIDCGKAAVGGESYPCGLRIEPGGKRGYVALSRANRLAVVDFEARKVVETFEVDAAPFDVELAPDGRVAFVSCWGGPIPAKGRTQSASGTPIEVDERGVAKSATVVAVRTDTGRILWRTAVGLQPSQILYDREKRQLIVPCANADEVAILDAATGAIATKISVKPDPSLPFGSAPNAVALDGRRLYVANGGNNAVAVVALGEKPTLEGFIPAGWYPGALLFADRELVVANVKGTGSRRETSPGKYSVYNFTGSISCVPIPDARKLREWTRQAREDAQVPQVLRAIEKAGSGKKPVPIPHRAGEPSTIEHVVYIIKENRTYDQVFGKMARGDNDPSLCMFDREVAPNHYALAETFVQLDNYYCNGVNSADGHAWTIEGNAGSYLEKSFGGFTRSYPFGDDPLSVTTTGFLWDHVLAAGLSFRNYGEFDNAEPVNIKGFKAIYDDWKSGANKATFKQSIGVERLRGYTNPEFPGWNMTIPDQVRADAFLRELKGMKVFPNLVTLYLPQDHTSGSSAGMPTPRAHVADNDLALGRVVEALSKSPFWEKMAIFVIEDDPQNGFDHVDGHRSICLVISPYARRGALVSSFHNQTSVLHTICRILGIAPLNAMVALTDPMTDCFTDKPDTRPYQAIPANVPLDELNPSKSALSGKKLELARLSEQQDLTMPDRVDDDAMNRILWHTVKGIETPYPAEWAGPHGRGLKARGLMQTGDRDDD